MTISKIIANHFPNFDAHQEHELFLQLIFLEKKKFDKASQLGPMVRSRIGLRERELHLKRLGALCLS